MVFWRKTVKTTVKAVFTLNDAQSSFWRRRQNLTLNLMAELLTSAANEWNVQSLDCVRRSKKCFWRKKLWIRRKQIESRSETESAWRKSFCASCPGWVTCVVGQVGTVTGRSRGVPIWDSNSSVLGEFEEFEWKMYFNSARSVVVISVMHRWTRISNTYVWSIFGYFWHLKPWCWFIFMAIVEDLETGSLTTLNLFALRMENYCDTTQSAEIS